MGVHPHQPASPGAEQLHGPVDGGAHAQLAVGREHAHPRIGLRDAGGNRDGVVLAVVVRHHDQRVLAADIGLHGRDHAGDVRLLVQRRDDDDHVPAPVHDTPASACTSARQSAKSATTSARGNAWDACASVA